LLSTSFDAGASVKDVSVRAGHTSAAFTVDRYGHRFSNANQALAGRLDDVFVERPETAKAQKIAGS